MADEMYNCFLFLHWHSFDTSFFLFSLIFWLLLQFNILNQLCSGICLPSTLVKKKNNKKNNLILWWVSPWSDQTSSVCYGWLCNTEKKSTPASNYFLFLCLLTQTCLALLTITIDFYQVSTYVQSHVKTKPLHCVCVCVSLCVVVCVCMRVLGAHVWFCKDSTVQSAWLYEKNMCNYIMNKFVDL